MLHIDNSNKSRVAHSQTGSLGSTAKSATTCHKNDDVKTIVSALRVARKKRFELLKSVRKIYLREGTDRGLVIPAEFHRTTNCKHAMTASEVVLHSSPDPAKNNARKGFYTGLQTCGSVWTCPICANRIQEIRRAEIAQAMTHFYVVGRQAVMVTFTFPHTAANTLKELLKKQSEALHYMRAGRSWSLFKNRVKFDGLIRSLEITRGGNGWHPHTHELWFIDDKVDQVEFMNFVQERWLKSCIKSGLVSAEDEDKQASFIKHSTDFIFNCSTSDYIAKFDDKSHWGADREMAKASSKKGKKSGMHPFELANSGYNKLFIEYTEAIKGKSQLFWSRGLKDVVGINDIDDNQISEETETDEDEVIGKLFKNQWQTVIKKELRATILEMIEDGFDIVQIHKFIHKSEWGLLT